MATNLRAAESGYTYETRDDIEVYSCASCGMLYGIPARFAERRRRDHGSWYCPNGHSQVFTGKSEAEAQRERAEHAEAQATRRLATIDRQRAEIDHQRRVTAAVKGHLTRMRRRIANGVCPVPGCKRSGFAQVMRHVATVHPDWHAEHVEALEG